MSDLKKILAISGSTRSKSSNSNLIHAISDLTHGSFEITVFTGLSDLPHFNPDLDNDNPPVAVADFRNKLKAADGVLICSPEYAMGVPGSLKNALDWTVSSCEFSHKPVAVITASSSGEKAHESLLGTLNIIEANIGDAQLLISYVKTKINDKPEITDEGTLYAIKNMLTVFTDNMNKVIEKSI